ncbi:MAG: septum formation initiator family protein [Blautia sp.]|nr:septum formation initiator family protein [Blautia sp.]
MFAIAFVVTILLVLMLRESHMLKTRLVQYDLRKQVLQEQIDEELARTIKIDELKEYMLTDEYAEEVARERLGLVKENEIVFKESEYRE